MTIFLTRIPPRKRIGSLSVIRSKKRDSGVFFADFEFLSKATNGSETFCTFVRSYQKLTIPHPKKVAALPVEDRPAAIARIHRKEPEEGGWIYQDGKLVEVHTNEVAVYLRRGAQVIDAIEALATVDVSRGSFWGTS